MLTVPVHVCVFVAHDPVDFRKSCDGVAAVVRGALLQDALSGHVFVFFNRHRNRIKILVWERNGYWHHYKRVERGTFEGMNRICASATHVECTAPELHLLLRGAWTVKHCQIRPGMSRTHTSPRDRMRRLAKRAFRP